MTTGKLLKLEILFQNLKVFIWYTL